MESILDTMVMYHRKLLNNCLDRPRHLIIIRTEARLLGILQTRDKMPNGMPIYTNVVLKLHDGNDQMIEPRQPEFTDSEKGKFGIVIFASRLGMLT